MCVAGHSTSEITSGKVQEYRIHRHEEAMAKRGRPPAYNTMHQEIVTLRQTLKTAIRQGWLDRLPGLSEPYRSSPKISHRAWFSPEEYKQLYEATKARARAEAGALSNGNASSFTTVCCSPPIQASGPMRRGASNFGT
jgi:hypothetical protein